MPEIFKKVWLILYKFRRLSSSNVFQQMFFLSPDQSAYNKNRPHMKTFYPISKFVVRSFKRYMCVCVHNPRWRCYNQELHVEDIRVALQTPPPPPTPMPSFLRVNWRVFPVFDSFWCSLMEVVESPQHPFHSPWLLGVASSLRWVSSLRWADFL